METFDLVPELPVRRISRHRAVATPAGAGFVQRKRIWQEELRTWVLTFKNSPESALTRLKSLWALTAGPVLGMTFTPPGESATTVRFVGDELVYSRGPGGVTFSATVTLEEVR